MSEKTHQSKPSYYAIIPADVRYDVALSPNSKLLYGEITALSSSAGYCWSGNLYFSELYAVSTRTIQRWLKELSAAGHIFVDVNESRGNERKIYLTTKMPSGLRQKRHEGHDNFVTTPHDNFVTNSNTSINSNTDNTNNEYTGIVKVDFDRLLKKYNKITGRNCTVVNEETRKNVRKRLKEGYTRDDIINTIINARTDKYHIDTKFVYVTLEYISRAKSLDKYSKIGQNAAAVFKPKTETHSR